MASENQHVNYADFFGGFVRKLISIAVLMACYQYANATTGNDLKQAMYYENDFYQGYVTGVLESGEGEWWCPSGDVEKDDLVTLVTTYIIDHPEKLHKNAGDVIIPPVIQKFPCKKHHKK